jgi:signal transduction histidine kinase
MKNNYIEIGKVVNTFGIKGELKIQSDSDFVDYRYQVGKTIVFKMRNILKEVRVSSFRILKGNVVITINDLYDINQVEQYIGATVLADKNDVPPLEEGEFMIDDIVGLDVYDVDKASRYIPIIRGEIARSLDIMSDFMQFSKIKIDKELIDINMLLEDIETDMGLLISSKNIVFSCRLVRDEVYIEGDYSRLKQVFINMIKNSMEAIEGEGKIEIVAHILKGQYYIEISDNGCGMDEETLSRVKEMFFTTKVKGTGLGVSLSNEIIKAHNGSIDYSSKVGKGTKVVVKLPIVVL